ncbi:hypothetical protein ABEB36_001683 [Hypothenemus hampei]|uniref:Uncharacterized protein n=1 Tax=Hypothenemus hampei TaxID=57062 RepID=A0ABD1FFD4_HYPHA
MPKSKVTKTAHNNCDGGPLVAFTIYKMHNYDINWFREVTVLWVHAWYGLQFGTVEEPLAARRSPRNEERRKVAVQFDGHVTFLASSLSIAMVRSTRSSAARGKVSLSTGHPPLMVPSRTHRGVPLFSFPDP